MRNRPRQLFLVRKAAAMPPAFIRVAASATVILAGVRSGKVFLNQTGQRNAQQGRQVPNRQNAGDHPPGFEHSKTLRAGMKTAYSSSQ